jgi:hypothetical protein
MPKLIGNIVSNIVRGRGAKAPALLARPKALLKALLVRLRRSGRSSGGYVVLSAGVLAAAVAVVSLLTFLAPDSDRPFIARPVQAVQSMLPGVLQQVEGGVAQAATLLGVDQESVQNVRENLREGLTAAHSGSISDSGAPAPGSLPAAGTATTTTSASEEPSSSSFPATDEAPPPPQAASELSAPSSNSGSGTGEASVPAVPTATDEASPPTPSEPTSPSVPEEPSPPPPPPPPAAEEPPTPPKDEPAPPTVEEPLPPPPGAEQPPAPPTAEEPLPPVIDQPEA